MVDYLQRLCSARNGLWRISHLDTGTKKQQDSQRDGLFPRRLWWDSSLLTMLRIQTSSCIYNLSDSRVFNFSTWLRGRRCGPVEVDIEPGWPCRPQPEGNGCSHHHQIRSRSCRRIQKTRFRSAKPIYTHEAWKAKFPKMKSFEIKRNKKGVKLETNIKNTDIRWGIMLQCQSFLWVVFYGLRGIKLGI